MAEFCPHCEALLPRVRDAFCPYCHSEIEAPALTVQKPHSKESTTPHETFADGMTNSEKGYSAAVLLCAGVFLVPIASLHFLVIPKSDNPGALYLAVSIMWAMFAVLATTTVINLCYRSLLVIPTIVQCVFLGLAIYFIPFAIWGAKLLHRRLQQAKTHEAALSEPSSRP